MLDDDRDGQVMRKRSSENSRAEAERPVPRAKGTPDSQGGRDSLNIPVVELPKGGGALKAIDETFQANSANGTASFNIPLPLSGGRNNFGPALSLGYDSGTGNGVFGLGWSLRFPKIQRRTDKRLPQYDDGSESDVFLMSGAEDMVPALVQDAGGNCIIDPAGNTVVSYDYDRIGTQAHSNSGDAGERWGDAATSLATRINTMLVSLKDKGLTRSFSARQEFPTEWHSFLNPPSASTDQVLTLNLARDRFPYFASVATNVKIRNIELVADSALASINGLQVVPAPTNAPL